MVTLEPLVCVGPVACRGYAVIARDIANLTAALEQRPHLEAFLPAVAPSGLGFMAGSSEAANEYYPSYQEYLSAVADALHVGPRRRMRPLAFARL